MSLKCHLPEWHVVYPDSFSFWAITVNFLSRVVVFLIGINFLSLDSPLSELETVYIWCLVVHLPVFIEALLGAQFAAAAYYASQNSCGGIGF